MGTNSERPLFVLALIDTVMAMREEKKTDGVQTLTFSQLISSGGKLSHIQTQKPENL